MMVRADRYALATALDGEVLQPWVRAIHGCNNPPCVREFARGKRLLHVLPGTHRDNMHDDPPGPRWRPHGGSPRRAWREGATCTR